MARPLPLWQGPFEWNSNTQGVLLASYFYGYLVTQVLGGRLAELFSAKWTFGISVLLNVVLALLSPPAAWLGWGYLLAIRIMQGMVGVSDMQGGRQSQGSCDMIM